MFTSWVILALVKGDRRTRVEVVEQVKKNMGEFLRIENREAFCWMWRGRLERSIGLI